MKKKVNDYMICELDKLEDRKEHHKTVQRNNEDVQQFDVNEELRSCEEKSTETDEIKFQSSVTQTEARPQLDERSTETNIINLRSTATQTGINIPS